MIRKVSLAFPGQVGSALSRAHLAAAVAPWRPPANCRRPGCWIDLSITHIDREICDMLFVYKLCPCLLYLRCQKLGPLIPKGSGLREFIRVEGFRGLVVLGMAF